MKTRLLACTGVLFLMAALPVSAQQPPQGLPNGVQYLQQKVAEDAGVIANLLDKLSAANAEIDTLKKAAAPVKPAEPSPSKPGDKK